MGEKMKLYVCHIDDGGPAPHACKRAQRALREEGHDFEKVVFGRGRLFGLFTKGRRPELKTLSGQEKLPRPPAGGRNDHQRQQGDHRLGARARSLLWRPRRLVRGLDPE